MSDRNTTKPKTKKKTAQSDQEVVKKEFDKPKKKEVVYEQSKREQNPIEVGNDEITESKKRPAFVIFRDKTHLTALKKRLNKESWKAWQQGISPWPGSGAPEYKTLTQERQAIDNKLMAHEFKLLEGDSQNI